MANPNIARGLIPTRYRSGAPYGGQANLYYVPSSYGTALFVGDPVIHVTNSADANGIPVVQKATAAGGNYILGAVIGQAMAGDPMVAFTRDAPRYHLASTAGYILVADDPDLLFEMQEDSVGGNMGNAGGRNVDLIAGNGSTTTGYSGWMLDSSTLQTTNTLQMRVYRPAERGDNDPTSSGSLAKWLVSINLHSVRNLTGV